MGGFGSGRSSGWSGRRTVDGCRSLDINLLHRNGWLTPGWRGGLSWSADGETTASIRLEAEENRLRLVYRVQISDGDWESVRETVHIDRVPCRYGGSRPYFICPGVVDGITCGRRVAKLYAAGQYFLCRHCYRLSYGSQSEDELDRANRRANKLKQRLAENSGREATFSFRPKGMWQRTYERRRAQIIEAAMRADEAFTARAMRLLIRFDENHPSRSFWS